MSYRQGTIVQIANISQYLYDENGESCYVDLSGAIGVIDQPQTKRRRVHIQLLTCPSSPKHIGFRLHLYTYSLAGIVKKDKKSTTILEIEREWGR